jgi:hypothetical protein
MGRKSVAELFIPTSSSSLASRSDWYRRHARGTRGHQRQRFVVTLLIRSSVLPLVVMPLQRLTPNRLLALSADKASVGAKAGAIEAHPERRFKAALEKYIEDEASLCLHLPFSSSNLCHASYLRDSPFIALHIPPLALSNSNPVFDSSSTRRGSSSNSRSIQTTHSTRSVPPSLCPLHHLHQSPSAFFLHRPSLSLSDILLPSFPRSRPSSTLPTLCSLPPVRLALLIFLRVYRSPSPTTPPKRTRSPPTRLSSRTRRGGCSRRTGPR